MARHGSQLVRMLVILALVFATLDTSRVAPAQEASPEGEPMDSTPGFEERLQGVVEVGDFYLSLVQVTMGPGAGPPEEHHHFGSFVLAIESGGICYTAGSTDTGAIVTVDLAAQEDPPEGCAVNVVTCPNNHCTLTDGDTIYLPEGSTVTQTSDAHHFYTNYGDETAVVFLSLYTYDDPGAGCGGTCW